MAGLAGLSLTKEEQMLIRHAEDMLRSGRIGFTAFLTEREQTVLRLTGIFKTGACVFYGGYPEAGRVMLGVFPPGMAADLAAFPIYPITVKLPRQASVTHRDVLGSLMALGITRGSIGDILVGEGRAFVFLSKAASAAALSELSKIGAAGVRCEAGIDAATLPEQQYLITETTVSSLRIDCVVAALLHKSRSAAGEAIAAGLVQIGGLVVGSVSQTVVSGDKIAIRGYGKAQIIDKGASKKGRIRLEIRKYL